MGVVNVADAEKQESCTTDNKYERWTCKSTKPQSQLAQLHDDDEDVFTSLIDRYAAWPVSLQNMCLATFAVTYDVIQSGTETEETDSINDAEDEMQNTGNDNSVTRMKLQKGLGIIRKRKQEAILGTRRYKIHTEPENITMQSYFCIIHGIMRMTSYYHLQLIMSHTSVSKI